MIDAWTEHQTEVSLKADKTNIHENMHFNQLAVSINCAPDLTACRKGLHGHLDGLQYSSSHYSQHSELYQPSSICIDSTNTVHVTDYNDCVHIQQLRFMYSSFRSGEGEFLKV